jgi:hypothetical protein
VLGNTNSKHLLIKGIETTAAGILDEVNCGMQKLVKQVI